MPMKTVAEQVEYNRQWRIDNPEKYKAQRRNIKEEKRIAELKRQKEIEAKNPSKYGVIWGDTDLNGDIL